MENELARQPIPNSYNPKMSIRRKELFHMSSQSNIIKLGKSPERA